MREITSALNRTVNLLNRSFSATRFPIKGFKFGNLAVFRTIFSHIFTAHAAKRLLVLFCELPVDQLRIWHRHSIPWPRFPYRERYFGDLMTFSVDFCTGYVECPPYFYFWFSWPKKWVTCFSPQMKISTKFEVDSTASPLWYESFTGYIPVHEDSHSGVLVHSWTSSGVPVWILQVDDWQYCPFTFAISQHVPAVCSTDTNNLWWQEFCRQWTSHMQQFTCGTVVKWCCGDLPKTFEDILV